MSPTNLADGFHELAPGRLAAVATFLEMHALPDLPPFDPPPGASIRRIERPALDWYRRLFRSIGEPWLWFSRLEIGDGELSAILWHPRVEVHALSVGGRDCGLLELDFRVDSEAELAFLGVTPDLPGKGYGAMLLRAGIGRVWSQPISRFWLHTCTLDHPAALRFYVRHGFRPYKRAIEIATDPRISGLLPRDAAPHIPLIEP